MQANIQSLNTKLAQNSVAKSTFFTWPDQQYLGLQHQSYFIQVLLQFTVFQTLCAAALSNPYNHEVSNLNSKSRKLSLALLPSLLAHRNYNVRFYYYPSTRNVPDCLSDANQSNALHLKVGMAM